MAIIQPLYRKASGTQAGTYYDMQATDTVAPIALSTEDIQAYQGPMLTLLCVDNRVFDKVVSNRPVDNVTVLSVDGDSTSRWIWRMAYREPLSRWGLIEGTEVNYDTLSKNNARLLSALDSGERLHAPGIYEFDNEAILSGVPLDLTGVPNQTQFRGRHDGAIIRLNHNSGSKQSAIITDIGYTSLASGSAYLLHATNAQDMRLVNIQSTGITYRNKVLYAENSGQISLAGIRATNNTIAYFKYCDGIDVNGITAHSTEDPWVNGWTQNDQMAVVNLRWSKNVVASNLRGGGYVHFFEWWGDPNPDVHNPYAPISAGFEVENVSVDGLWVANQRMSAFWGFSGRNIHLKNFEIDTCGDVGVDFERCLDSSAQDGWIKNCGGYTGGANTAVFWISKGILFKNVKSIVSDATIPHPDPLGQVPDGQPKWSHAFLPSSGNVNDYSAEDVTYDSCEFTTEIGNGYMIRYHEPRKRLAIQNCTFINTYNNTHICATYELVVDNNTHWYNNDNPENMIALLAMAGKPRTGLPGRLQITNNRIFYKSGVASSKERIGIIAFAPYTDGRQHVLIEGNEVYGATMDINTKRLFDDTVSNFVTPTLATTPIFNIRDNVFPTGYWLREEQAGYIASTVIWERNRKADGTLFLPDKIREGLVRLTKNAYSTATRYYYIGSLLATDNPNSFARALVHLHGSTGADVPYKASFFGKSRNGLEIEWSLERVASLANVSASLLIYEGISDPASVASPKNKYFDCYVKVPSGFNDVAVELDMWWDWQQTGNKRAFDESTIAPTGSLVYDSAQTQPNNWIRSGESNALGGRGVAVTSNSGTKYFKLGSLPLTTADTNYSSVRILANVGPWASASRTEIDLRCGSKGGFTPVYRKRGVVNNDDGIVAYNNGGVIDLFLVLSGSFKQGVVATLYKQGFTGLPQDLQALATTVTPAGTKVFDSRTESVYPQAVEDTYLSPLVTLLPPDVASMPANTTAAGVFFNASNGLVDVGVSYAGTLYTMDYPPIVSGIIDGTIVPMFWDTVNKKRRYTTLATLKAAINALP